jgi:hypothetical protein
MKALALIALGLGLAALAAGVYARMETYGHVQYFSALIDKGSADVLDERMLHSYRTALDREHLVSWAAGGLALILGVVVRVRDKNTIAVVAAVLGAAGALLTLLSGAIR